MYNGLRCIYGCSSNLVDAYIPEPRLKLPRFRCSVCERLVASEVTEAVTSYRRAIGLSTHLTHLESLEWDSYRYTEYVLREVK